MIEELKGRFEEFKELVNTLPVNNIANRRKKKEIISKELSSVQEDIAKAKEEIQRRLDKINSFTEEDTFELENKLEACRIINELNDFNNPFEKMHLDYYLYQLHNYTFL